MKTKINKLHTQAHTHKESYFVVTAHSINFCITWRNRLHNQTTQTIKTKHRPRWDRKRWKKTQEVFIFPSPKIDISLGCLKDEKGRRKVCNKETKRRGEDFDTIIFPFFSTEMGAFLSKIGHIHLIFTLIVSYKYEQFLWSSIWFTLAPNDATRKQCWNVDSPNNFKHFDAWNQPNIRRISRVLFHNVENNHHHILSTYNAMRCIPFHSCSVPNANNVDLLIMVQLQSDQYT